MQEQELMAARRWQGVSAWVIVAMGLGAAPAALAYNAQITSGAGSVIHFLDYSGPADSKVFDLVTNSTNLTIPLTKSLDTSISVGPSGGHYAAALGAYNAMVEPGGYTCRRAAQHRSATPRLPVKIASWSRRTAGASRRGWQTT